jgi:chromosome segregation ATPase
LIDLDLKYLEQPMNGTTSLLQELDEAMSQGSNNVIRLFARKGAGIVLSEPETRIATAVTTVLASSAQLDHTLKELSKHFDTIENAIDSIDDAETRNRLKQSTNLSRETLSEAMLKLSRQIGKLVNCRGA